MKRAACFILCGVAISVLAGCARQSQPQGMLPGGQQPSSFPVYSPSTMAAAGKYDDTDAIEKLGSGFFGSGPDEYKPYIGVQELIKTSATLDQLNAWLKQLVQAPPPDLLPSQNTVTRFTNMPEPSGSSSPESNASSASPSSAESASPAATEAASPAQSAAPSSSASPLASDVIDPFADSFKMFGLLPAAFWAKDRSRVVMIIVLDPKQVASQLGPTMDLMDQYDKLPALVRGGIDQTIKKNTGFSISDLTNTNTPMGMIVYAARNYRNEDTRAIVLVDALRQPNPVPTPHETGT